MDRLKQHFQTIRSEGGLLPPDLLRRVLDPHGGIGGTRPEDYGLPQGERLNEVITSSWNRLRKHWTDFRTAASSLLGGGAGTGLTNDKWSLPLLRELSFGILTTSAGPEIGGRTYAISRFIGPVPVHLVGCNLSLDRRTAGQRGAAAVNPHGLVQEFLNRSSNHLWAIVSNGFRLRVLRDNQALSRQSFLEFDLETMFEGEVYSDFVLFWLIAHATRFVPREEGRPETCWLEQWTREAEEQGTRALGDLRQGVERALKILGEGFTSHSKNTELREALRMRQLTPTGLHEQLLRIVYRLIFLFVAEDRILEGKPLLHPRDDSKTAEIARKSFAAYYSTSRLRELAGKIKGSRHGDLWCQFQLLAGALSGDEAFTAAREHLALPALGSFLWNPASTAALNQAELSNNDFLEAIRHLAYTRQGKVLRPVDYRNLATEELGGVYEGLLALQPQVNADGFHFNFMVTAGNERKTSGSYYTPDSLVQCLLDSALDPIVEEAVKGKRGEEAEKTILDLKVCDPAVGSGHFLVGAAHRLARHLARIRALAAGESEPSPMLYQHALRDVIGRCLYGVDVNPMAAELCRVSLWLEALEPGKPLSFLDHHIRVGNSLLGATPSLLAAGLPDKAFQPIEGDEQKACTFLKKRNRAEREGLGPLFARQNEETQTRFQQAAVALEELPDDRPEDIRAKERAFRRHEGREEYRSKKQLADAWCAAFMIRKYLQEPGWDLSANGITQAHLNDLAAGRSLSPELTGEVERLSGEYRFFHWHLVFPEVFAQGGFDCVLGNPPWEHNELKEKEWFAERCPEIANARSGVERKRMIEALKDEDPPLHYAFTNALRRYDGVNHFLSGSGRYPFCGLGRINLYAIFAEEMRTLLNERGRAGCVLPTGIATDDTTKFFFQDVVGQRSLVSLYDFENKGVFFPGVHSSYKFCLFTVGRSRGPTADDAEFVFFAHTVEDLSDSERRFTLSADDITLLNPNTRTCPIFRSRKDAELTRAIYRRVPVLIREERDGRPGENPWGIRFKQGLFNMTSDSHLFRTRDQLEAAGWILEGNIFKKEGNTYLPLYEAKMIHHFDHRWATYDSQGTRELTPAEKRDPNCVVLGRYWVRENDVENALVNTGWNRGWLLGWRNICRSTDERTVIGGVFLLSAVGNNLPIWTASEGFIIHFSSILSSLICDFTSRFKIGGTNLNFFITEQIAVLVPTTILQHNKWNGNLSTLHDWLLPRTLELTYTAWDLEFFARDCGWEGPPFRWDEERRFLLRCELDAAFFHLYLPTTRDGEWCRARIADGYPYDETPEQVEELRKHFPTPRDAVAYIMDTFPIVRRRDEAQHDGDYRTKRVILEIYDAMQESIRTGRPYQTVLDPPPADPIRCHPPREVNKEVLELNQKLQACSPTDRHVYLLCRIIDKHLGTSHEKTLGTVKAEKIAHIVESRLGIDLGREPARLAAGPADFPRLKQVIHRAKHRFAFKAESRSGGQGTRFSVLSGFNKALRSYEEIFAEQVIEADRIIDCFVPMDTDQSEIVATLYAVWNDLLADGGAPTDGDIIDGFYAWDSQKSRYTRDRLLFALKWMRENELCPTGRGKRSQPG